MRNILVSLLLLAAALSFANNDPIVRKIVVDLKAQKVFAYEEDGTIALELKCSTGRRGLNTPVGEYKITEKVRHNRALPELGGAYIPFTLRVPMYDPKQGRVRRIGFHEYKNVPDYPASSGCIRLRKGDAEKLYKWARVGDIVHVVKEIKNNLDIHIFAASSEAAFF